MPRIYLPVSVCQRIWSSFRWFHSAIIDITSIDKYFLDLSRNELGATGALRCPRNARSEVSAIVNFGAALNACRRDRPHHLRLALNPYISDFLLRCTKHAKGKPTITIP